MDRVTDVLGPFSTHTHTHTQKKFLAKMVSVTNNTFLHF